jgi:hypothetical protein
MLAGAMLTAMSNLDTLMSVRQGASENKIFNQDAERLVVSYQQSNGKTVTQTIPVNFGPFTWGHKIFGSIPWGTDHVEAFPLENGDTLRVTRFLANCTAEENYAEGESGVPAVRYTIVGGRFGEVSEWIAADSQGMMKRQPFGPDTIILWRVDTPAELDHFVKAVPERKGPSPFGSLGWLAYSHAGKHHLFRVEDLQKQPVKVPDSEVTLTLLEYLPNAKPGPDGRLTSDGDEPKNPALRIQVTEGGKDQELLAFGLLPEFGPILARKFGTDHLVSYFPTTMPTTMQMVMGPGGQLGYRVVGSEGVLAAEVVKEGEIYPAFPGMTFSPTKIIASGRPDYVLRTLPIRRGKRGNTGVVVELESGKEKIRTGLTQGMTVRRRLGDRLVSLSYSIEEAEVPFKVRLDSFDEPKNPGTSQAAMYTSYVTLFDEDGQEKKAIVTMNAPLHYTDKAGQNYTLYQSNIDRSTGIPISTFTVANDPGLKTKYAGAIILCSGIVMMFYMGGYFKKSKSPAVKDKKGQPASAEREPEPVAMSF